MVSITHVPTLRCPKYIFNHPYMVLRLLNQVHPTRSRLGGLKPTNERVRMPNIYGLERGYLNARIVLLLIHKLTQV